MLPTTDVTLTPDQIAQIEQARKLLPQLKAQIRKAKQAGIDMSSQEADLAALESQLNKLYATYVRSIGGLSGA